MEYLLKASTIIMLFYICYYLFLRRDTFFESNRWFLLCGLITAFCIPFIVIPIHIEQITSPIQDYFFVDSSVSNVPNKTFDIIEILSGLYIIGLIFFLIQFFIQIYSLSLILIKNAKQKYNGITFVETNNNIAPFSFFNWIVYNPNRFSKSELNQIITHEKVHVQQWHSIDILITQITSIILWFNPIIWLYRKNLQQNLEFIADHKTQQKVDCKKSYQHLLVKTSMPNHQLAITNNFYNSLIKKRIVMLHKKRSKDSNRWKFALILPLLTLFLMSFNTKEIITYKDTPIPVSDPLENASAYNNQIYNSDEELFNSDRNLKTILKKESKKKNSGDMEMVLITKDFSDAEFEKIKKQFDEKGITIKFKGIKRNGEGEIIAIKIEVNSKSSNANYNTNSEDPINPIKVTFDNEGKNISIGNTSELHFGHDVVFVNKEGNHKIYESEKENKALVFKSDDEDHEDGNKHKKEVIIFKKDGKVQELKKAHKVKDIHVISGDDDEVIDINVDDDHDKIIIKNGTVIKEIKHIDEDLDWDEEDGKTFKIESVGQNKSGSTKFIISSDSENDPLFILDGKEISKEEMDALDADTIKNIEVVKGDMATKQYGEKAKYGVVAIKTKD